MAWAGQKIKEMRFVIEDELTQVYVLIEAQGDAPLGVQGWHHKTFPKTKPVDQILTEMYGPKLPGDDKADPVLWPLNAPSR